MNTPVIAPCITSSSARKREVRNSGEAGVASTAMRPISALSTTSQTLIPSMPRK